MHPFRQSLLIGWRRFLDKAKQQINHHQTATNGILTRVCCQPIVYILPAQLLHIEGGVDHGLRGLHTRDVRKAIATAGSGLDEKLGADVHATLVVSMSSKGVVD